MSEYSYVSNDELIEMILRSEDLSPSERELVGRFEDAVEELESLRSIRDFIFETGVPTTKIAAALRVIYDSLEEQKHGL
jgi:hypothetical protein